MTLFSVAIASISGEKRAGRPFVKGQIENHHLKMLYDTGADISCISEQEFRQIPVGNRPNKLPIDPGQSFQAASGNALQVKGMYNLPVRILGKTIQHKFCVIRQLSEPAILGADFIHQHALAYCPIGQEFFWKETGQWTKGVATITSETHLPPFSVCTVRVNLITDQGTKPIAKTNILVDITNPEFPLVSGGPGLVHPNTQGQAAIEIRNCGPTEVTLPRGTALGTIENAVTYTCEEIKPEVINKMVTSIAQKKISQPASTDKLKFITDNAQIKVPSAYKDKFLQLLHKHHRVFSKDKSDLGRADLIQHEIILKSEEPVYVKQFKIPDTHHDYLQTQVKEWLKLGIIQPAHSRYNSPVFLVDKKDGGYRVVQDFRALNASSHIDKYTMKDVSECIGEIGRSNSTIFTTLDLTSGFWQMLLHPKSRPYTAFTVPGMGQFQWVTSAMGLLGCPATFQRLVETVVDGIANIIVYIDDLIIHSQNYEKHLTTLDELFTRLQAHNLKVNLNKCVFGSKEVMYLGFHLTESGIKPGIDKLKAVKQTLPPKNVHEIRQFLGLCNFFRNHVRNFAQVTAPLTALTRKDNPWKNGELPIDSLKSFRELQTILCSEPVIGYPRRDRDYALITDAALGDDKNPGGLGAILTQIDQKGEHVVIAYASRKLQKHEKNYTPFLIEMQAAIWGMEHFHTYLRGRHFTLFTDHKPLEKLGKVHNKTLNRLQEIMNTYDFEIIYKKGSEMPADFLSRNVISSISLENQDLANHQQQDPFLSKLRMFLLNKVIPNEDAKLIMQLANDVFIENNVLWRRIKSPTELGRVVILLPKTLVPQILQDAHGHLLTGHDGIGKTKQRIIRNYWWPKMDTDIMDHLQKCHQCQVRRTDHPAAPTLLSPLPQCTEPNQRIHADLFGPLKTSENSKKFILCMTDAFTKYVELVALPDKEALTVTSALFNKWICRYGLPLELITDQGKEFANKMSDELYTLLKMKHQTTSARHPQCNAAAEVCNKTIAKYLNSFVDTSTLDWELYLAPLMFSYNTSYHRSVKNSPYFLTFGIEPRLPSFPAPDLQRVFYGESSAAEMHQRLLFARNLAVENNLEASDKYKSYHDTAHKAQKHSFQIQQLVLLETYNFLGKNTKLSPKWSGPHTILALKGDHNVELLTVNNKKVIVNVARIKPYFLPNNDHIDNSKITFSEETEFLQPSADQTTALLPGSSKAPSLPSTKLPPSLHTDKILPPSDTLQPSAPILHASAPSIPPTPTHLDNSAGTPIPPRKRGRPPRSATPLPAPSHFQNNGGVQTRSQTRAHAHTQPMTRAIQDAQQQVFTEQQNVTVNVIRNKKTATKIKRVTHLLAQIYGCKCTQKQKEKHTPMCQQTMLNTALFGDVYKTHDLTPQQQSNYTVEEDTFQEDEELVEDITDEDVLDEDPNTSRPTSPHTPIQEGQTPEPFFFKSGTPSPIPIHRTSPVPDGAIGGPEDLAPYLNPESETLEVDEDTPSPSDSAAYETADSISQLDSTIEFITEQLENLVAQRDRDLQRTQDPIQINRITQQAQIQAEQLRNHILLLQQQKQITLFDPSHTSSPAPRRPNLLQQLDSLIFNHPHTRRQGPPQLGPLPEPKRKSKK